MGRIEKVLDFFAAVFGVTAFQGLGRDGGIGREG
jgi:hypothetical protein